MDMDELASAAVRGNDEALLQRINMDKHRMYGIAYSYMRNEADALEAVQETVCRVWAKRRSLRDPKLFTTWIIRILIRVCMDERKKKRREQPSDAAWLQQEAALHTEDTAERLDLAKQLLVLPANYRMVIVLKYYRDLTIVEIAELLERPDGTIRTWLNKALRMLRSDMTVIKGEGAHEQQQGQGRGDPLRKGDGTSQSGFAE
ncbi:MAG: sigma-70 family RNA polymerase sigma factor [Candidatus Pristimantibacillus sp.]